MTEKEIDKECKKYAKKEALETCGFVCIKCKITPKECPHYDALYSIKYQELKNRIDVRLIDWLKTNTPKDTKSIKNDLGYLYFINKTGTPEYKIGITSNIKARMSCIKSASGNNISILCIIQNNTISDSEQFLHNKYDQYRKMGEWFVFDVNTVESVKSDILALNEQVIDAIRG